MESSLNMQIISKNSREQ